MCRVEQAVASFPSAAVSVSNYVVALVGQSALPNTIQSSEINILSASGFAPVFPTGHFAIGWD
jgi:hypothetical protein